MAEEQSSGEGSEFGFILVFIAVLFVAWMLTNFKSTGSSFSLHSTSTPSEITTSPTSTRPIPTRRPVTNTTEHTDLDSIERRVKEIDAEVEQIERERNQSNR